MSEREYVSEWPPTAEDTGSLGTCCAICPPIKVRRTTSPSPEPQSRNLCESEWESELVGARAATPLDSLLARWWKVKQKLHDTDGHHLPNSTSPKTTLYHVSKSAFDYQSSVYIVISPRTLLLLSCRFPAANAFIGKRIHFLTGTRTPSRGTDTLRSLAECYHAQGHIDKALKCAQQALDTGEASLETQWHYCVLKRQEETIKQQLSMLSSVSKTFEELSFPSPTQVG